MISSPATLTVGATILLVTGGYREMTGTVAAFAYRYSGWVGGATAVPGGPGPAIVGIAASPTGQGYWELSADGAVFGFGGVDFTASPTPCPPGPMSRSWARPAPDRSTIGSSVGAAPPGNEAQQGQVDQDDGHDDGERPIPFGFGHHPGHHQCHGECAERLNG